VFDGPTPAAANVRIEFRALPAQPTIRDGIAFVAAFAGFIENLPRREHPVASLDAAVREMQETYVERQAETLVDGTFREWLNE